MDLVVAILNASLKITNIKSKVGKVVKSAGFEYIKRLKVLKMKLAKKVI